MFRLRLESDPSFMTVERLNMSLAVVLRIADRFAGNIMWSLSSSRSLCKYIPLVASAPGLMYFHDGLIEGFIMDDNISIGLGIILYHESPKSYGRCKRITGDLSDVLIHAFRVRKYVSFVLLETARNILWFELILLWPVHILLYKLLLLPKVPYIGP